jgi:hypothetical protein
MISPGESTKHQLSFIYHNVTEQLAHGAGTNGLTPLPLLAISIAIGHKRWYLGTEKQIINFRENLSCLQSFLVTVNPMLI